MKNSIIDSFEKRVFNKVKKHPDFRPGDTVRVHYKIPEGADKFRIQHYEGVVLRKKKGTVDSTFTVRKIGAGGVGVERVFPLYSPFLDKIDIVASGVVRRARLYYLRDLTGKAARIRSKFFGGAATTKHYMEEQEAPAAADTAAPAAEPAK